MKPLLFILAAFFLLAPRMVDAREATSSARTYALLIGSNRAGSGQSRLLYAHGDARRMAETLTTLGGVAPADVELLLDPDEWEVQSALDGFEDVLEAHARRDEKTVFIFYYSGHARSTGLNLGPDEFSLKGLRQRLVNLPATVRLVILDACQTGAFSAVKGATPAGDFSSNSVSDLNVTGMAVIASSAGSELSQESPKLKGSYFSHHFTVGLKGAADVDRDGIVTLSEAYRYAYHRTLSATAATAVGRQHVILETDLRGKGEMPLTFPGRSASALELPASLEGDILLTHVDSATVAAEIRKVKGEIYRVALPAGAYEGFVNAGGKKGFRCAVTIASGRVTGFDIGRCEALRLEDADAKGRDVVYAVAEPVRHPRREWVMLELQLGYLHGTDSTYTRRLEDFGYRGLADGKGLAAGLGLVVSPLPFLSVGFVFAGLDRREGHSNLTGVEQDVSWKGWRLGGFLRGNLTLGRRLFVPYVQFGAGFARTELTLTYNNTTGRGQTTDPHKGFFVSWGAGLQVNPVRWFGLTILQVEYVLAEVLEMTGTLDEAHNGGGLTVTTGVRFGY